MRRQAELLHFVQLVGGNDADSQANKNQHNRGSNVRLVRDDGSHQDG